MTHLEDHGLPLVRFKEYRRELVVASAGSKNTSSHQIAEIASIQHAIAAINAVICDLDAEVHIMPAPILRLCPKPLPPASELVLRRPCFMRRRA